MATKKKAARVTKAVKKTVPAAYARYLKIALKLPGTEESISYGTPSVKLKGKILSRLRTEAEGALALCCDFIDREMLLQADPEVFFITDHYRDHPMILVRLDKIRADALPDLVERAWKKLAPKKVIDGLFQDSVRSLIGALAGKGASRETYRKYLTRKYR